MNYTKKNNNKKNVTKKNIKNYKANIRNNFKMAKNIKEIK